MTHERCLFAKLVFLNQCYLNLGVFYSKNSEHYITRWIFKRTRMAGRIGWTPPQKLKHSLIIVREFQEHFLSLWLWVDPSQGSLGTKSQGRITSWEEFFRVVHLSSYCTFCGVTTNFAFGCVLTLSLCSSHESFCCSPSLLIETDEYTWVLLQNWKP